MMTTISTTGCRGKDQEKGKRRRATGRMFGGARRCFYNRLLIGVLRPETLLPHRERSLIHRRQVIKDLIKFQSRASKHHPTGRVLRY